MKKRLKAAFIHLCLSSIVIGLFLSVVFFIWYPQPYAQLMSVWDASAIMVLVDVVLGPTLTLVVYDFKKPFKELRRDLSIIAVIQLSALVWGIHVTHSMRPMFTVFAIDQLYIFNRKSLASFDDEKNNFPSIFEQPKLAYSPLVSDGKKYKNVFSAILEGDMDENLFLNPLNYLDFSAHVNEIRAQAKNHETIIKLDASIEGLLDSFLKENTGQADDYLYYVINVASQKHIAVFDKQLTKIVGVL